jgi:alkaline phosphatase
MRTDGRNLLNEALGRGFSVVHSDKSLAQSTRLPLLGLFSPLYMADAFQEARNSEPSLARMTEKALTLLESEKGFFLMVEAGQIDGAAHLNDAGWVLAEMLRLSSVLEVIEQFARARDDTLVLLTGDHETGGMGLSYRKATATPTQRNHRKNQTEELDFLDISTLRRLRKQKLPIAEALLRSSSQDKGEQQDRSAVVRGAIEQVTGERLAHDILDDITDATASEGTLAVGEHCSVDKDFYPYGAMKLAARVGRAVGARQGVVWATGTHTTTPVPVMVKGPMQERFVRWQRAGDVGRTLLDIVSERRGVSQFQ